MSAYEKIAAELQKSPRKWLVTGAAGFIGSHLTQRLLELGQTVIGVDNFSTGHKHNLDDVKGIVGEAVWKKFQLVEGSVSDPKICKKAVKKIDLVLHQGALGSVPRSIDEPAASHVANVDGFLQILEASRLAGIKNFVYASSSSVYGDEATLPKVEERVGRPLSPYAATKAINEVYANVYSLTYGMTLAGLRYFNVFGPRQDPNGAYAAVIPRWIQGLLEGVHCEIHGDGKTSRDFCFVENVVQANILAALNSPQSESTVFNVALGGETTLNQLFADIVSGLRRLGHEPKYPEPKHGETRKGDIRHSKAAIERSERVLGYVPAVSVPDGLKRTVGWYLEKFSKAGVGDK